MYPASKPWEITSAQDSKASRQRAAAQPPNKKENLSTTTDNLQSARACRENTGTLAFFANIRAAKPRYKQ